MYSFLAIVIVTLAALGFAWMLGISIYKVWVAPSAGPPPDPSESFTYVATGIAALVGGIVAIGFGVKPQTQPFGDRFNYSLMSFGSLIAPWASGPGQQLLAGFYGIVYVLFGTAAIVTWVVRPKPTTTVVKNLATTFLSMAVAVILAFFHQG